MQRNKENACKKISYRLKARSTFTAESKIVLQIKIVKNFKDMHIFCHYKNFSKF